MKAFRDKAAKLKNHIDECGCDGDFGQHASCERCEDEEAAWEALIAAAEQREQLDVTRTEAHLEIRRLREQLDAANTVLTETEHSYRYVREQLEVRDRELVWVLAALAEQLASKNRALDECRDLIQRWAAKCADLTERLERVTASLHEVRRVKDERIIELLQQNEALREQLTIESRAAKHWFEEANRDHNLLMKIQTWMDRLIPSHATHMLIATVYSDLAAILPTPRREKS